MMNAVTASSGWAWVKQGFVLFRKQPVEMLSLFFAYMFFCMAMGFIPLIGQYLPLLLVPVFAMSFMEACRRIENGQKVHPGVLLSGFRSPALLRLLALGLCYIFAVTLAILASSLVDQGVLWDFMTSQKPVDPKTLSEGRLLPGILASWLAYLPALMAFWYAAPLICWRQMSVAKAAFYSFFAVKRAGGAFVVYGLSWIGIGMILPFAVSATFAVIVGKASAALLVMMPLSIVLTVVLYCSFYPTYTDVFDQPEDKNHAIA